MRRFALYGLLFVAAAAGARADDGTINTERPGFSSSPLPLARGLFQLEGGYQFTDAGDGVEVHQLPQLVARAGLADNLELQLSWPGYQDVDFPGGSADGITDLSVGLKTKLTDQHDWMPTLGLFGALSLPIGDDAFTSDEIDPTVGLFWTYDRAEGPGLFGTLLASSTSVGDDRRTNGGVSLGTSLPIDDERLGGYVEVFTLFGEGSGPAHNVNGGLTWLYRNDVQFDAEIGIGLNDRADDYFIGFGAARRF